MMTYIEDDDIESSDDVLDFAVVKYMDSVELPLPATIVTKIMRSSGCSGGGGVTMVELLGSQSERETCSSSFHPEKDDNCNANNSRPVFWNKMSEEDLYRSSGQLSSHRSEETFVDHDMAYVPEAKHSQRKSGKSSRSNGSSSRRSRAAHMEASMNLTGVIDPNDLQKEHGKYNISGKQKTSVSGKRSDKRNGKIPKNKCDSFSVKAGLSSFSSSAGGNNILGVYGSKHSFDLCEFGKHVDEVSLTELLEGTYKCPDINKEKKTETLNGSILLSVREACSILQLQNPSQSQSQSQTPNATPVDGTHISGVIINDDNTKSDTADPSSCNKLDNSNTSTDHTNILQSPLFPPKDVLDRLSLLPPKDLDLMLLDSMKPTSTSKVQNGGSLPTFPWSHISGGHFKANPDMAKSTPSKNTCQGRWAKMGNKFTSGGKSKTCYLKDFEGLTYDESLVPLTGPTENEKSQPPSIPSKNPGGNSSGVLSAAQTLCDIAARYRSGGAHRWLKKSTSHKSIRSTKLMSADEKLEKALFAIPSSRPVTVGPTNDNKTHSQKKVLRVDPTKAPPYHWPTVMPQSSRSSPSKQSGNNNNNNNSNSPLKRSITTPPVKLQNKPPKLRKLIPMEWKSNQKGNGKY
ncbi:hypothetical protein LXL04_026394 [Taraxacum kok-saghyz]